MKKLIAVAAAVLLTASSATISAQNPFNSGDNHTYVGARLSLDVSAPSSQHAFSYRDVFGNSAGMSLGFVVNTPIVWNLYLEPGLSIYYNTISQNSFENGQMLPGSDISLKRSGSLRLWGARIPIMVGYRFDILNLMSLYAYTGPRFSYTFSGRWNQKLNGGTSQNTNMYAGDLGLFNRFDAQWSFGVGASFSHYYIGVLGNIGMSEVLKGTWQDKKNKMRKNGFEITVGYNF